MRRWLPDAHPLTPEIYTDMNGMYPTHDGGYATIPTADGAANLYSSSDASGRGGYVRFVDGTVKFIWATLSADIFEDSTDVTGTAATMRTIAMFGNVCILAQGVGANTKAKTGTGGTFADLAGSPPKAEFVVSNNTVVMLLNYNDGTTYTDGWWASDIGDHTTWTPASSNQAANGRLTQAPGPIRGAIAFRDAIYAFKDSSVFVGRYVGRPLIWQWQLLRSDIGCSAQEAILTDGDYIYFFGDGGIWRTDGSSFNRIDDGIWGGESGIGAQYYAYKSLSSAYFPFGLYDSITGCCMWWHNTKTSTAGYGIAYNTRTGMWGDIGIEAGLGATLSSQCPTAAAYPYTRALQEDAANAGIGGAAAPAWPVCIGGLNGEWLTMNNAASAAATKISAYVTTEVIGSVSAMTNVKRVTPILVPHSSDEAPNDAVSATFTLTPYTATSAMADPTAGATVSSSTATKRFDYLNTARFHQFKIANATHSWKIVGIEIDAKQPAGTD